MQSPFSPDGITVLDFAGLSASFVTAMLVFFGTRNKRHWLNLLFAGAMSLHWLNALIFKPLPTKLFTTLLLLSLITVEVVVLGREKGRVKNHSLNT